MINDRVFLCLLREGSFLVYVCRDRFTFANSVTRRRQRAFCEFGFLAERLFLKACKATVAGECYLRKKWITASRTVYSTVPYSYSL